MLGTVKGRATPKIDRVLTSADWHCPLEPNGLRTQWATGEGLGSMRMKKGTFLVLLPAESLLQKKGFEAMKQSLRCDEQGPSADAFQVTIPQSVPGERVSA